jgi:hypothetical protein
MLCVYSVSAALHRATLPGDLLHAESVLYAPFSIVCLSGLLLQLVTCGC